VGKSLRQSGTAILLSGISLVLAAQSFVAAARHAWPMKRIVVFGDSLSAGLWLKPSEAWPMLLANNLGEAGLNYRIDNYSESGGTTLSGLKRLGPHLKDKIDIFILELGINDAMSSTPQREIRQNLQKIMDRVKRANPDMRMVICGVQIPTHSPTGYLARFDKMYVDLAAKNNAVLVPHLLEGVLGNPQLNSFDRIHPNPAGQEILVENVWRVLEPIAREVATTETPARVQ
jgi:acyl-CoA thioesterase I